MCTYESDFWGVTDISTSWKNHSINDWENKVRNKHKRAPQNLNFKDEFQPVYLQHSLLVLIYGIQSQNEDQSSHFQLYY